MHSARRGGCKCCRNGGLEGAEIVGWCGDRGYAGAGAELDGAPESIFDELPERVPCAGAMMISVRRWWGV